MHDEQLLRYSRHIALPEFGFDAQKRLEDARAVIVGVGGLGSHVAQFLAASGVGTLILCDEDAVDVTNLQRQTLFTTADIGKRKVEAACLRLLTLNPEVIVRTKDERVDEITLAPLLKNAQVVVDCSDNFATRHAVNRAAFAAKIPHVMGAAIRFDGQVTVFDHRHPDAPCYNCLFSEHESLEEARCATLGVFSPIVGVVGAMQAAETLKLLAQMGALLSGRMLMMNVLNPEWQIIALRKNADCAVCGKGRTF